MIICLESVKRPEVKIFHCEGLRKSHERHYQLIRRVFKKNLLTVPSSSLGPAMSVFNPIETQSSFLVNFIIIWLNCLFGASVILNPQISRVEDFVSVRDCSGVEHEPRMNLFLVVDLDGSIKQHLRSSILHPISKLRRNEHTSQTISRAIVFSVILIIQLKESSQIIVTSICT